MNEFICRKSQAEVYSIRPKQGFGWGIFMIDEGTGSLSVISDYENYNYRWGSGCFSGSFKKFLTEIDTGYLLDKVAHDCIELKFDESVVKWKKEIIEARRENGWEKEKIRELWDDFESIISEYQNEQCIQLKIFESELSNIIDVCEGFGVRGYDSSARQFADELWPMFIDVLKKEINEGNPGT